MHFRLILPKSIFHFHNTGFQRSIQWRVLCSNAGTRKVEVKQGKGAVAEETNAKKIVDMHPGVFPKVNQVQNKVGGSGYTLKGMFSYLKERFLGSPQLNDESDATTTDVTLKCDGPPKSTFIQPGSIFQSSEAVTNFESGKERVSKSAKILTMGKNSSVHEVDTKVSEVIKKHSDNFELRSPESLNTSMTCHLIRENSSENIAPSQVSKTLANPGNTELAEFASMFVPSEATMDPHSNEKNISINVASHVKGEDSFEEMDQWRELTDNTMIVKPKKPNRKLDPANSGVLGDSDKNQKLEARKLLSSRLLLWKAFMKLHNDDPISAGNLNNKFGKRLAAYDQTPDGSQVGETPASPDGPREFRDIMDLVERTMNSPTEEAMDNRKTSALPPNEDSQFSNETSDMDIGKLCDLKSLIKCINKFPRDQTLSTVKSLAQETNKLSGSKEQPSTEVSITRHTESLNRNKEAGCLKCADNDHLKLEPCQKVLISTNKKAVDKTSDTFFKKEASSKNQVLVRFLPNNFKRTDVVHAFLDCGDIAKIEESPVKDSIFTNAFIHFKTREGLQKALGKTDVMIGNADVVLESISSEHMPDRISIPNLISDHDVPTLLVKNPTRTVMIKTFTHDVCSHYLEEALALDGYKIASLFIDSSTSVAYVEFETEEDKEKALAKHFIHLLGKKLCVFRIESPRTTVLRISNISPSDHSIIRTICNLHGKVNKVRSRSKEVVDVHFKLEEWPNMLNILNSLNGLNIDGHHWLDQPANVFPPDVLQILLSHPDGRSHVKATIHKLLEKFGDPIDTCEFSNFASKYFKDEF